MPEEAVDPGTPGKIKMTVSIDFDTDEEALTTFKALKVDDDDHISTSIEGRTVVGKIEARTVDSARRSADDWIACMMAVKKDL